MRIWSEPTRLLGDSRPKGPGEIKYVGVESFVAALNDQDLEYEVLKLEPTDTEVSVSHVVRL